MYRNSIQNTYFNVTIIESIKDKNNLSQCVQFFMCVKSNTCGSLWNSVNLNKYSEFADYPF